MKLRRATMEDAIRLLRWRNDAETRAQSFNGGIIEWEAHRAWLAKFLADPRGELLIAMEAEIPVGTVRLEEKHRYHELSWTVAPEHRGKGYGKAMVMAVAGRLGAVEARIKAGNVASVKIAESAGMRLLSEVDGILRYGRRCRG